MELTDIRGKVAVVTGASSGIGEAAARLLAGEGVKVLLAARRKDRISMLAEELGENAIAVTTDVGNREQVKKLFERVKDEYGGLDLLFNNAGVGYFSKFEQSDPDEWKKMIDANIYGVLNCTREAIPLMRGREGAMISTVSSVGGRYGIEGWSVYNATKFAVVGFCDALRKEVGPDGIRVSLIEPGAVYTEWGFNVEPDAMKERRDKLDAIQPEAIAQALLYAFAMPANVNVQEQLIMPVRQTYP